jgi:hypothetical protein
MMRRALPLFLLLAACSQALAAASPQSLPTLPPAQRIQPYLIGGDVKPPVVLRRVEPKLTKGMPCRGLVILKVIIDDHGNPVAVVDRSKKPDAFTRAYAEAIAGWKFKPGTLKGRPVAVEYIVTHNIRCQ